MFSDLWVRVFAGKVSKVAEYLALHVVLQGGKPVVGLVIHRVMKLQKLHQLFSLHLIGQKKRHSSTVNYYQLEQERLYQS